jgi:hypothetical protein
MHNPRWLVGHFPSSLTNTMVLSQCWTRLGKQRTSWICPQGVSFIWCSIFYSSSPLRQTTPVFSEMPARDDLSTMKLEPEAILDRRLVKKGNAATPQVQVKWLGLS